MTRFAVLAAMLAIAACSDIPLSPGSGPAMPRETGPLIVPPAAVRAGTAE